MGFDGEARGRFGVILCRPDSCVRFFVLGTSLGVEIRNFQICWDVGLNRKQHGRCKGEGERALTEVKIRYS